MKNNNIYLFASSLLLSTQLFTACGTEARTGDELSQYQPHKTNREAIPPAVANNSNQWHKYVTISSTYDISDSNDHKLSFDILFEQGISSDIKHFQIYVDTDFDATTGWSYGQSGWATIGADYMIENGILYKSTSNSEWTWTAVDRFDFQLKNEANNSKRIKLIGNSSKIMSITDIENVKTMAISIEAVDADWQDTNHFVSSRDVDIDIIEVNKDSQNPVKPDPVKPDPVKPDPIKPDPIKPDPVKPDPVKPDPIKPDPIKPDPVKPDPVRPDPVRPGL